MDLKNKIVVITGAGHGFGACLAREFAKEGAQLVLADLSTKEIKADVTKEKDVEKLAKFALKKFGRIDVWVNNAGVWLAQQGVQDLDIKRVKKMFDVNVFGLMAGSKYALKAMQKHGGGVILKRPGVK